MLIKVANNKIANNLQYLYFSQNSQNFSKHTSIKSREGAIVIHIFVLILFVILSGMLFLFFHVKNMMNDVFDKSYFRSSSYYIFKSIVIACMCIGVYAQIVLTVLTSKNMLVETERQPQYVESMSTVDPFA